MEELGAGSSDETGIGDGVLEDVACGNRDSEYRGECDE